MLGCLADKALICGLIWSVSWCLSLCLESMAMGYQQSTYESMVANIE